MRLMVKWEKGPMDAWRGTAIDEWLLDTQAILEGRDISPIRAEENYTGIIGDFLAGKDEIKKAFANLHKKAESGELVGNERKPRRCGIKYMPKMGANHKRKMKR